MVCCPMPWKCLGNKEKNEERKGEGSLILVIKFCRLMPILDEKMMEEERMRENEGMCLFENV